MLAEYRPPSRNLVWVTRAEPGASQTAERVSALGHTPLLAPLLEVRFLPGVAIDLEGVGSFAFTSANGVRAFAALTDRRDHPVFAVGESTAQVARAVGFNVVGVASEGVEDLAGLIVGCGSAGLVLHPGAVEIAGDLAGTLHVAGVPALAVPVYATTALRPPEALEALAARAIDLALIHSPKAARALSDLARESGLTTEFHRVRVLALSPACLAPLEGMSFRQRSAAAQPYEAALLSLL